MTLKKCAALAQHASTMRTYGEKSGLVITKIVECAKAGESDPERLCIDVLAELEPQGADSDDVTRRESESHSQSPE
jgi:hypothetical protein